MFAGLFQKIRQIFTNPKLLFLLLASAFGDSPIVVILKNA